MSNFGFRAEISGTLDQVRFFVDRGSATDQIVSKVVPIGDFAGHEVIREEIDRILLAKWRGDRLQDCQCLVTWSGE